MLFRSFGHKSAAFMMCNSILHQMDCTMELMDTVTTDLLHHDFWDCKFMDLSGNLDLALLKIDHLLLLLLNYILIGEYSLHDPSGNELKHFICKNDLIANLLTYTQQPKILGSVTVGKAWLCC